MDKVVDKAPDAFRTISEVADDLDLPQHVLRFWETRFVQIRPMKRGGGRRFYRREDVELLRGIRHLLYGEGYTIRGVQRILKDHGARFVQTVWQVGAPQPPKLPADRDETAAGAPAADQAPEPPRARGLFGILPGFGGGSVHGEPSPEPARSSEEREPPHADLEPQAPEPVMPLRGPLAPRSPAAASRSGSRMPPQAAAKAGIGATADIPAAEGKNMGGGGSLAREYVRQLQTALHELGECRRLIDAAHNENAR